MHTAADEPPADVDPRRTYYDEEVAYWIPRQAALVVGDAFTAEPELKCQDGWLPPGVTREQMHSGLSSLLEEDGREALRAALGA